MGSKFEAFCVQAVAYFRWVNAALAATDKEPLIINMDEVSLCYHITGIVGTVLRTQPHLATGPKDRSRLSDRRGNITYMASICNDVTINQKLPQVVLGNCRRFAARLIKDATGHLPNNIVLWREKSAWNNHRLMQRFISLLCRCLGEDLVERAVYLVVDMAPCHIHPEVWATAMKKNIRMILVPAGLTGCLQPLDTHVFRQFRAKIQELWPDCKAKAERGQLLILDWLKIVAAGITTIVSGPDWQHAFERTGLSYCQALLAPSRLQHLRWEVCPELGAGLPPHGQAGRMFPRRSKANVAEWVEWRKVPSFKPIQTLD